MRNNRNYFWIIPLLSGAMISSVTGLLHNRIMTSNIQEYFPLKLMYALSVCFLWHSSPDIAGVTGEAYM